MKKIMFNDQYGLTQAVLEGRKTMTRRIVGKRMTEYDIIACLKGYTEVANNCAQYKIGEIVAVTQCYGDCGTWFFPLDEYGNEAGYTNKMFVKSDLMPHQIRITDIKVERMQDILNEDCLKEGVNEDLKGVQYSFDSKIGYCGQFPFATARQAFAALINKVSGKGTWERNPWVFVYTFELVK